MTVYVPVDYLNQLSFNETWKGMCTFSHFEALKNNRFWMSCNYVHLELQLIETWH